MVLRSKALIAALSFGILGFPIAASAQIYDGVEGLQNQDLDLQTSINFKIPLGAKNHSRLSAQPRLSFGLSLANNDFGSPLSHFGNQYPQEPLNLLNVGTYGFKVPSVQLVGQEIHTPTFDSLHANEPESETEKVDKGSNTTVIVVAGLAVAVLGGALFLKELEDEFADCFDFIDRPGECAD